MIIPIVASHQRLAELLEVHRAARLRAGHPAQPRMHVTYHCYVAPTAAEARTRAEEHYEHYKVKQLEAYGSWRGVSSSQYPGYERMEESARTTTLGDLIDAGNVIVGDVDEATKALLRVAELYPGAEASLQVRFGDVGHDEAMRTVRLLGNEVLPTVAAA
jgi:alkanesulfonate monooxygenase SsuD/methylene tetrahydromethanopterin reductase-like flavin-dependent oxidoreductase (luciferase family)